MYWLPSRPAVASSNLAATSCRFEDCHRRKFDDNAQDVWRVQTYELFRWGPSVVSHHFKGNLNPSQHLTLRQQEDSVEAIEIPESKATETLKSCRYGRRSCGSSIGEAGRNHESCRAMEERDAYRAGNGTQGQIHHFRSQGEEV